MFLESSRYYKQKLVEALAKGERTVKAVTLRRLPSVSGKLTEVKGNDRLDIMAQRQYDNPTMFWLIGDANTELESNNLVRRPGRIIKVPEQ